jgi:hypothetical protein
LWLGNADVQQFLGVLLLHKIHAAVILFPKQQPMGGFLDKPITENKTASAFSEHLRQLRDAGLGQVHG